MKAQNTVTRRVDRSSEALDSFDYCINFWEGALDEEEDAREIVRSLNRNGPAHVRAFDDVA